MKPAHAKELNSFFQELRKETDRGLPLVGAAFIDDKLGETLQSFFVEGKSSKKLLTEFNAPLGTFSSRIEACFALGLIDEHEYQEIKLIKKIRNEIAHAKHGISFQDSKIKGYCSSLKSDLPRGDGYPLKEPRFRFENAVICIVLRLYFRPALVKKERRSLKHWVEPDASRWRRFEDEEPTEGASLAVLFKRKPDR